MQRICLFPGTFDPVTLGHTDIIDRALPLFDKLVIGIGRNTNKEPMFSDEQRLQWIKEIYKGNTKVDAVIYEGLTVECCKKINAGFILRGIRYVNDFEYEKAIAEGALIRAEVNERPRLVQIGGISPGPSADAAPPPAP